MFFDFWNSGIYILQSSQFYLSWSRGNESDILRTDIIVSKPSGVKVWNSFEDLDYDIHNILFSVHFSSTNLADNVKSLKAFHRDVHMLIIFKELIVLLDLRMM